MSTQFKVLFIVTIALVILGFFIFSKDNATQEPTTSTVESIAPAIMVLPRLIELGSVGCRPCDMMSPILEELRKEYSGKLSVEFYDVRKDPAPAQKYRIRLIPTQIFLKSDGKEFFRHEGFYPKEEIIAVLDSMGVAK